MGKKKSKIVSFFTFLIFLLLAVAAIGAVVKLTGFGDTVIDPDNSDDVVTTPLVVTYGGVEYTGADNEIEFPDSGLATFSFAKSDTYKIEVLPNVTTETDFTYFVNDKAYYFGDLDFTNEFIKSENFTASSFSIDCSQNYKLVDVLSRLHNGATVTLNGSVTPPYILVITASNGETVSFKFGAKYLKVYSVSLPEQIIFYNGDL